MLNRIYLRNVALYLTRNEFNVNPLENGIIEGENPVHHYSSIPYGHLFKDSRSLGLERKYGWYIPSKAKYILESDRIKVP